MSWWLPFAVFIIGLIVSLFNGSLEAKTDPGAWIMGLGLILIGAKVIGFA